MKKRYNVPEMELQLFEAENVITASGDTLTQQLESNGVQAANLRDVDISDIKWTY